MKDTCVARGPIASIRKLNGENLMNNNDLLLKYNNVNRFSGDSIMVDFKANHLIKKKIKSFTPVILWWLAL